MQLVFAIFDVADLSKQVVSAYEFELHAGGTKTRHPNNHIYLDNGRPLYSIIQVLRTAPFSTLDSLIKSVAGSYINEEYFLAWKGNMSYFIFFSCALKFILMAIWNLFLQNW